MKRLLVVVGLLMALPLLWVGVGGWLAARQAREVGTLWAISGLSVEEAARGFPKTVKSPAALAIETAAVKMGIRFGRSATRTPEGERLARLKLGTLLEAETRRGDDVVNPISAEALSFLANHAEDLRAIRSAAAGELTWECDITKLFDAPIPSLAGFRGVQHVLAADALARLHRGDVPGAMASIEAGWRIQAALRKRPDILSQMVALYMDDILVGVLRKIPPSAPGWGERVREHDHRRAVMLSLQVEVWILSQVARGHGRSAFGYTSGGPISGPPAVGRMLRQPLEQTFFRLAAGTQSRATRRLGTGLTTEDVCTMDKATYDKLATRSRWNFFAGNDTLLRVIHQSLRRALDAELTQKILERDTLSGSGTLPSSVCSGVSWRYQVKGDEVSIGIDRDPQASLGVRGLPLTFVGRRPRRSP